MKINKKEEELQLIDDMRTLLLQSVATTQEAICEALLSDHPHINQSKVSRLLHKLGAVKTKNATGQVVYRLTKEPLPPSSDSQLRNLVISIKANETTIVVSTSPGSASLIARLLDYKSTADSLILGVIAGDDTVFVIPVSVKKINQALNEVKELLFTGG